MENCGFVTEKNEPVPLKSISVEVRVQDHVATVSSTLQYVNEEERPLEALFVFPLPADAAVCHFSAKIGEQEIVAEVQDRENARDQYDDAVSSGQQAFLLEESEESPDVFKMSVGCLSAGQNAAVTIIYVTELAVQADHSLRFCLPAVLNPRYTPAGSGAGIVSEISSGAVPYTLSLSVHVSSPKPISKIESNCTLDPLVFLHSDHSQATVNLSPGHMFDKDVELFVYYQDTHQPSAIVEAGMATAPPGSLMSDPVVMISLHPEFPEEVMSSLATQGEFVFVIDRSGSMGGMMHHGKGAQMRIESAKDTLLLLLKSLPMGCYFNIYGFGSRFESFFPQSVEYNQDTMDQALKRVKEMQADMGGTEILEPLKHIYSQPCYPDHPRQLFIFTDGEVGNTKEVLDLVKGHADSHRCFSFGIGEGASAALITGMAREGSGHAQFITDTDHMQPKVMQSLRFALQPAVVNISVDWTLPDGVTVDTLSPPINVLFQGERTLIYAQLKGESSGGSEGTVTVKYRLKNQPVTNQLHFCLKPTEETELSIHRLAARTLIRSLEQKERSDGADVEGIRSRMVELSVQAGVSSVHTAFIAVNKDSRQTVKGPLLQRRVPTCDLFGDVYDSDDIYGELDEYNAVGSDDDLYDALSDDGDSLAEAASEPQKDLLLQLVSLQKASGCWDLDATLADVFGKTEDELTNQKPAQVDGSVWATLLALIWLYGCKIEQQVEWQLVAMKAASWIGSQKVPLKSISVEVRVQDHVATVSSTLQYVNEEERPLEALFVFPLPADAAVCHFSAKIGEQEIVAEVQERQKARDQYDDAVSSGQQAFLLEESEESPDVFKLSVGCLSAGQNAAVTIIYIMELAVQADHSLRFCLPAVLNPRYTPAAVPYTLALSVHVSSPKRISKLESNCTLDPLVFLHSDHTQATVNLSPGHMFDKDIELFVYYQDTHQPSAIVEAGVATAPPGSLMRDPVVMINLYPEFPEKVMKSLATRGEFIFVIDRSGSMSDLMYHGKGAQIRIESAKSVEYNQDTVDRALKRVKEMQADMGGTEILQPLKHIYSQRHLPNHPRQLFVFTDGEVGNTKEVLDLVKSHAHSHRCFSFGIGEGASAALITGMAREGSGHAQFITDTDRRQPKVMQSLRFALQPAVVNISVDWTLPNGVTVDTLSPPINVLFQGSLPVASSLVSRTSSTVFANLIDDSFEEGSHQCNEYFLGLPDDSFEEGSYPCEYINVLPAAPKSQMDPLLQLVSLQKASGCWELDDTLADVFGMTEDELIDQKPAQVDGSVWATLLALIWLYGCKIEQQVEWQFVAMKAVSWIGSQKGAGIVSEISSGAVPYTLTLSVHVSSPKPISKIESNCTLDPLVFLHSDHTQATVNLSPGHMFDKDVELFVYYQDTHQPSAIVEAGVATAPPVLLDVSVLGCFSRPESVLTFAFSACSDNFVARSAPPDYFNSLPGCPFTSWRLVTGLSIHRLAVRTLIRSLEQKERSGGADVEGIRSRMVELSVQAGVSSVHTAFIAVNKDSRQTVKGPLLQRRVLTQGVVLLIFMTCPNKG
ncbi:von Willebrand factor A domain-containing 5A-like protein [Labeo rohita]|uniref:von Willebrand factor A domain-containing 5A-like protein n=1 Tax=Labeo rohita TaxID=84645 RepID=A0A498LRS0_LABRO|nr:von Willebrand factor A domain-containing 5A-like protein [Labeo rohita]